MPSPQANDTPWWFHPGSQMRLCFTPKRNHSIMTQCSVRGILAFRRGVVYFTFYVAAVVKPPCVCFFPPFWTLWHRASIALAPSCGVGTSHLVLLSLRAGSHARPSFLD